MQKTRFYGRMMLVGSFCPCLLQKLRDRDIARRFLFAAGDAFYFGSCKDFRVLQIASMSSSVKLSKLSSCACSVFYNFRSCILLGFTFMPLKKQSGQCTRKGSDQPDSCNHQQRRNNTPGRSSRRDVTITDCRGRDKAPPDSIEKRHAFYEVDSNAAS